MKKLVLVLGVGMLMSFSLNSCSKCATCTADNYVGTEVCKGNTVEDAIYAAEEAYCSAVGGTFE